MAMSLESHCLIYHIPWSDILILLSVLVYYNLWVFQSHQFPWRVGASAVVLPLVTWGMCSLLGL